MDLVILPIEHRYNRRNQPYVTVGNTYHNIGMWAADSGYYRDSYEQSMAYPDCRPQPLDDQVIVDETLAKVVAILCANCAKKAR